MGENYPHEQSLRLIRAWPHNDFEGLMEFVESLWRYAEWGFSRHAGGEYSLSTGGWSGNEEIITALQGNGMFWSMCWEVSRRGGHYSFKVSKVRKQKK